MLQENTKYGYVGEFDYYTNNHNFEKNTKKTIMLELLNTHIDTDSYEKIKEILQNKYIINFFEKNSLIEKFNIVKDFIEGYAFLKKSITDNEKINIVKSYLKKQNLNEEEKIFNNYFTKISLYKDIEREVEIDRFRFIEKNIENSLIFEYFKKINFTTNRKIREDYRRMRLESFLKKYELGDYKPFFEKIFNEYILRKIGGNSYSFVIKKWKELKDNLRELYIQTYSQKKVYEIKEYQFFSKLIREKYDNEYCIYEFEHLFERKTGHPRHPNIERGYFKIYVSNYFNIYCEIKNFNGLIFINRGRSNFDNVSLPIYFENGKTIQFKNNNKFILDNHSIDLIKKYGIKTHEKKEDSSTTKYLFEFNFNINSLLTRKESQIINDDFLSKTIETNKKLMDDNIKLKEENMIIKEEIENIKKKFEEKYLSLFNEILKEKKFLNNFKINLQNRENEIEKHKEEIKEKIIKIEKANYILLKNKKELDYKNQLFEKEKEEFETEKELFHSTNLNTIDNLINSN